MSAEEPGWWYATEPTLMARALGPIGALWGQAAERRYRRGEGYRARLPVICVGNFTAGGTGKTPLALHLAALIGKRGAKPAFLSRGHGGSLAGPHWVRPERDSAAEVGDEPLLLVRASPTMIARDRAAGARAIEAAAGCHGAIVMDDGLQNGSLAKDLSIALVDSRRGIGNGRVIPAGPLRAPLAFQLELVDAIVVNAPMGTDTAEDPFPRRLRSEFGGPVITATTVPSGDTSWLDGAGVAAFCGIGAPERFFALLERLGAQLLVRRAFRDHHVLSESEALRLMADAAAKGAQLVTTEKDWVRLGHAGAAGALRLQARVLAIRLEMGERDGLRLKGLVDASLGRLGAIRGDTI